jgi:hypothetical protein
MLLSPAPIPLVRSSQSQGRLSSGGLPAFTIRCSPHKHVCRPAGGYGKSWVHCSHAGEQPYRSRFFIIASDGPPYRSATFDILFLDHNMRVTRGDRRELRVFIRDTVPAAVQHESGAGVAWDDTSDA